MSQPVAPAPEKSSDALVQEASQTCSPRNKCRRKRCLLAGLILGSLAAVFSFVMCPPRYEAQALIQVRAVKPQFLFETRQLTEHEYNAFVGTQIALLRSPAFGAFFFLPLILCAIRCRRSTG